MRTSRLAIAGSLLVVLLAGGAGFMVGRGTAPPRSAPPVRKAPQPTKIEPPKPPESNLLSRADLLAIADAAADATASGKPPPPRDSEAEARRFNIYLPFGCDGSAAEKSQAPLRWRYEAEEDTLRVHLAPTSWQPEEWWRPPPSGLQALQGFWVARPWSSSETCTSAPSAVPSGADPVTLPGQTLALAEVVTSETPRQLERIGKPYESVIRVAPADARFELGLRLRLRGRMERFPTGETIRCVQPGGVEQRPICLVAVSFDEIAVENPATRETLAVWSPTAANAASGT